MVKFVFLRYTNFSCGVFNPERLAKNGYCFERAFIRRTASQRAPISIQALTKQLLALVEMQNNPRNFSRIAQVRQQDRFLGLQVSVVRRSI